MKYQAKQEELDVKKWLVSEKNGSDACGDFDYCKHCDKTIEYPCAVESEKAEAANKPAAKPAAKKTASAKPAAKKADVKSEVAATSAPKATTAKKPSASRSAAKK